jgi:NAD(P)-dependent dehydrogenase (short-subunit alcohol dehydrogenase family)
MATYVADVSIEEQMNAWADSVRREFDTDHIHLLINNAGIGGGGSIVAGDRAQWEKTFNVCWGGVYFNTRAFLPLLLKADQGHIVNTSSINGFWASVGPNMPHTAYSAAKFAVKGFSEALIADLRVNAPHIHVSVVMPGHIGTSIPLNSRKIQASNDTDEISATEIAHARARVASTGKDTSEMSDDALRSMLEERARKFVDEAPTTAIQAATIILDGVKADRWRILVGDDAHRIDTLVRQSPERAYDLDFFENFATEVNWRLGR